MKSAILTTEQWHEWLLEAENRFGLRSQDEEAQKRFLVEWYFRRMNLDKNIMLSDPAVDILREVRTYVPGLRMPRFLHRIYKDRPDLQQAFPPADPDTGDNLIRWYASHGRQEFPSAVAGELVGERRSPSMAAPSAQGSERAADHFSSCHPAPNYDRSGVNLVGYAQGEFGLGEDIRTLARCLEIAAIPYSVVNLSEGSNARLNDRTLDEKFSDDPPYAVSIMCISPFEIPRIKRDYEASVFNGRYVIAYAPWELETFPPDWQGVWDLVDEVWAISAHVHGAYAQSTDKPCFHFPPAVNIRQQQKLHDRTPQDIFQFVCPYDPNSFVSRKNPQAVIEAFTAAFPRKDEPVSLLLLVNGVNPEDDFSGGLGRYSSRDSRIDFLIGTHDRKSYIELLASSDCFVSAHRAEGFGRNVAESKALGLAVLATGYSGVLDFISPEEAVSWKYSTIGPKDYLFAEGMRWAEIDISHLTSKMRKVFEDRMLQKPNFLSPLFSPEQAAARYARRLTEITESLPSQ
jgi:glycosyltransferase involved in cell wall biosynthesis